jgi:hypothetical protein
MEGYLFWVALPIASDMIVVTEGGEMTTPSLFFGLKDVAR